MYCSPSIFLLFHSCCLLFTQRRCRNCHTDVTLTLYPHLFIKTTCFFLLNFPCTLCLLTITVPSHIKFRIDRIEILTVQIILHDSKTFTKSLVMHDFTLSQERIGSHTSGSFTRRKILSYVVLAFCSAAISSCRSVIGSPFD